MVATIEYFFTPVSGFAYLGHAAVLRLAEEHRCSIRFVPVDMLRVFAAVGVTPPPKQPAPRLRYRQIDMERWATCRRLPIVTAPRFSPTDTTLGACAVVAALERGWDAGALAGALLGAVWHRELDIADGTTVQRVADECGLDGEVVLAAARSPASMARYVANTEEAIARGVLGSPTFFVEQSMFFGQDRLGFVRDTLHEPPAA